MVAPMINAPGGPELILIVLVIMLLFGAKKLPELARGSGRALRIFKAETRGLMDDDDDPRDGDDRPTRERRDDLDARPELRSAKPEVSDRGGVDDVEPRPEYRAER